jgi:hypothetical protein
MKMGANQSGVNGKRRPKMNHVMTEERSELCELLMQARENAAPAGWSFTVKVWAVGDNPIRWVIESQLKNPRTDNLVFNKNDDHMPQRDYYVVNFLLQDFTGLDLRFEPNPMNAFWVAVGDKTTMPNCPKSAAYNNEIYAIADDDPNGKRLTIRNDDVTEALFSYSLGFIDGNGNPHRCDPGGDNQDGNYRFDYD